MKKECTQNRTTLAELYFININDITRGEVLKVNKLCDFSLYKELKSKGVEQLNEDELQRYQTLFCECEEAILKEGNYLVNNDDFYWEFTIDNEGLLFGESYFLNKEDKSEYYLMFDGGIAVSGDVGINEALHTHFEISNTTLIIESYNELGIIQEKTEVYLYSLGQNNMINYYYYPNGQIEKIENDIDNVRISYYQNGQIERIVDLENNSSKCYLENGQLVAESIQIDQNLHTITYENGVLVSRSISNEEQEVTYFYVNDQVHYSCVLDYATEMTSFYDSNGVFCNQNSVQYA
ncbi:hypothetical protein [Myroides injenensis]|uniref:hypothetical protein n=1 Tax=Myroides injenensis TaxID=1183151 RepID=UPI00028857F9|nr:hypothetical protein [Myroides injenensis]